MKGVVAIFVNIPCPSKEEAVKLCTALLEKELCGLVRIYEDVHQMYFMDGKVDADDIVMMHIKTTQDNLKDIEAYIMKNHSWGTPCVDVVPIITDHC